MYSMITTVVKILKPRAVLEHEMYNAGTVVHYLNLCSFAEPFIVFMKKMESLVIPPECRQAWNCCIFPTLSNMTDYPIFVYMFRRRPAILYTNVTTYT
jgi:hypothetical protein